MKTEEELIDEHWDAAENSRKCYDVAIAELRKEFLAKQKFPTIKENENKTHKQRQNNGNQAII